MNDKEYEALIEELSNLCGILPEYYDISGKKHITSLETKKKILRSMKINIDSSEDIKSEIEGRRSYVFREFMEPIRVLSESEQPVFLTVYVPDEGNGSKPEFSVIIEDEDGGKDEYIVAASDLNISETCWIGNTRYLKVNIRIGRVFSSGYYKVYMKCKRGYGEIIESSGMLIIAPDSCYLDERLMNRKTWGISLQLYSIRSSRSWGVGDTTDLKNMIRWIWSLGGGFIGINPMHALTNRLPSGICPYYPISRLYKNFIYIDIEEIPEVKESREVQGVINSAEFQQRLEELRRAPFVDYEKIAKIKEDFLRIAFNIFYEKHYINNSERALRFRRFILSQGEEFEKFSLFLFLQKGNFKYSSSTVLETSNLTMNTEKELLFYKFVQWIIDEQMEEVSELVRDLGLPVGLYQDLAVAFDSSGYDAWWWKDIVAEGVSVGSPPDDFNPEGQVWGMPPLIPERLKQTKYEIFIKTLRNNMRGSGALRIDHAASLFRLFWIPEGMSAKDGAYVVYPSEDLLKIIALESVRNKTMIIVEDLGTVTDEMRDAFRRYGMLSSKVFYFERNYPDPSFKPPESYPEMSICMVTTHDLPTLYGYWKGYDLKIKREIGVIRDDSSLERLLRERERDKGLIISALVSRGVYNEFPPYEMGSPPDMKFELCKAIYRFLSLTPSKLLSVSIEDIIGILEQQNIPGTDPERHPNWMRKIPMMLEEIFSDNRFFEIASIFRETSR